MISQRIKLFIFSGVILIALCALYYFLFSASGGENEGPFIVPQKSDLNGIVKKLKSDEFIRSEFGFRIARLFFKEEIQPGGYEITRQMNVWTLNRILSTSPSLLWVKIQEGLRKEEIGDRLQNILGWSNTNKESFLNAYKTLGTQYKEGYYFPDTYLIPKSDTGFKVAKRMIDRFQEIFAPLYPKFLRENIKIDTGIKLASLIQREAAGKEDMALISGILWNRLLQGMKLDIDATLQYIRGDAGSGFWAPLEKTFDRTTDSPYNTYKYKGLPPTAISNPGFSAFEAVVTPSKTSCLYYLHDSERQIHCAKTYEEHKRNIEKYLK